MAFTTWIVLACCVFYLADCAPDNKAIEYGRVKRSGSDQTCTLDALDELRESLQNELDFLTQTVLEIGFNLQEFINLGLQEKYPAPSCSALYYSKPQMPSGHYWLSCGKPDVAPAKMYCNMHKDVPGFGSTYGWMQLAHLDMKDSSQYCPDGFKEVNQQGKRACAKTVERGCQSIVLPTYHIQYSRVCGRAHAYQIGSNNAFHRFGCKHCTIDDPYVDGISVTYGSYPRQHIWSLAASWTDYKDKNYRALCPCSKGKGTPAPEFVGYNYFCETGKYWSSKKRFDANDPLWDGEGCSSGERECCEAPGLPWFCTDVPKGTGEDIEVRVCADEEKGNEDLYLEQLEIFVQ